MNLDWSYPVKGASPSSCPYWRSDFADLDAVRARFSSAGKRDAESQSVTLFNVWWMPGRSFVVIYRLRNADGTEHVETVRFVRPGESQTTYETAKASARDTGAITHLVDWSAVSWRFPEDEGLPALPALIDCESVRAKLTLPSRVKDDARWALLSYLPSERAAVRFEAQGQIFAGKIQQGTERTHSAMKYLWHAPQRKFSMAEPVLFDNITGARWERFLPGRRFDLDDQTADHDKRVWRTLEVLAQLHALPVPRLVSNDATKVMERIVRKVKKRISTAVPRLTSAADETISRLARTKERLSQRELRTIHGDFHTANVIFDDDEPGLIDFDNLALGDPEYDLALFATRILLAALAKGSDPRRPAALAAQLPHMYGEASGRRMDSAVFAWYMAALLVGRQVKTCIRHAAPELEQTSQRLLAWADAILSENCFDEDCIVRGVA